MAGITHYINTAATEPTRARWPSLINSQPQNFPVLILGDTRPHQFFFHYDGTIEDFSGNASYTFKVSIGDVSLGPVGGSYTLTCGVATGSLAFNAVASDIQTALNALPLISGAGGVLVTGTFPNFLVSWVNVGAQTALTSNYAGLIPSGVIGITSLQTGDSTHTQQTAIQLRQQPITTQTTWTNITSPNNGWSGTLTTNTAEAIALLISQGTQEGELWQYSTVLQASVIDGSGNVVSYFQLPIILRASNLDVTALNPTPFPSVAYVQNRPGITGLVSASADATKLGGLPTISGQMPVGAVVALNFTVNVNDASGTHGGILTLFYQLISSIQSQASPGWVRPYDFDVSANPYVWRLIGSFLDQIPAAYNDTTGNFHYMGVAGAAGACYAYPDQTGSTPPA